jgi:hypothetical protein
MSMAMVVEHTRFIHYLSGIEYAEGNSFGIVF